MPILAPERWDSLYYERSAELSAVAELTDPRYAVRAAHARYHLTQNAADLLKNLKTVTATPALGLRLLALCDLGHHRRVLESNFRVRGSAPEQLEEAVYGEWALSIAHAETGAPHRAFTHLDRAAYLAEILGLTGRLKLLALERERQRSLAGHPDAKRVLREVRGVRNVRTARFGYEIYVETLLAQGHYGRAHQAAIQYRLDGGLSAFTAAMARTAPPFGTDDDTPLGQLAQAVRVARLGQSAPLPQIPDEPWRTYAALVSVVAHLARGENVMAGTKLPRQGTPDQCAAAAGFAWAVWLRTGDADVRPLSLPQLLSERLSNLYNADALASWLVASLPSEMMVLHLAGFAHPAVSDALMVAPVLSYGTVRAGLEAFALTKSVCEALLLDGMAGDTVLHSGLFSEERRRYRNVLRAHDLSEMELVNPGTVYRFAGLLEQHAQSVGREVDRVGAALALRRAEKLLPERVKESALYLPWNAA